MKAAERRMFTRKITESDAFLDMPSSSQMLYFHLNMAADDDGFVNNPKKIQRMCGASDDDFKLLIAKSFVIIFESGIIVIKHWKMHNYIQSDRYHPTDYQDERSMLGIKENKAYTLDEVTTEIVESEDVRNGDARKKRQDAFKESDLPSTFDQRIRNAFLGEKCPICGVVMSNAYITIRPTIQHNKPISLGGKHELSNISVICQSCNCSIQNRVETPPYNTDLVKERWECIQNGYIGKVRLGKDSIGKDSIGKDIKGENSPKEPDSYYPNDELLNDAFTDFVLMRKKIKKPMTARAIKSMIKRLDELSAGDNDLAIKILDQSTMNCWQNVYALKDERGGKTNQKYDWDNL